MYIVSTVYVFLSRFSKTSGYQMMTLCMLSVDNFPYLCNRDTFELSKVTQVYMYLIVYIQM